ncbi:response regulator [Clostridium sp. AM58-1XD]|uniref:hybrid sensor histidine kinase/response regulator n=1 Tax=Clostridium sp. AM58-1XD TaxID=2292307 RepID=UPI0026AAD417
MTRKLAEDVYLCEGNSWMEPKKDTGMYFRIHQRVTFIFKEENGKLFSAHIHNSVDYSDIKDDELFPVTAAKEAFDRLQDTLEQREREIFEANQDLKRQAGFLKQLYDSIPCGILQFTPDSGHRIVSMNSMVWKFYGYSSEEEYRSRVNSPVQMVMEKDRENIEKILEGLRLGSGLVSYTREAIRLDGSHGWISVLMERLINADGQDVIQAIFMDITALKAFQTAQEQERLIENYYLRAATCTAYPLIVSINLTQNQYNCFLAEQQSFVGERTGVFDEMVSVNAEYTYPSYREDFCAFMSRKNIMKKFADGEHELYMEVRQEGVDGKYHWISIQIINVENPVGSDMLAIELVKVLDKQRAEQARQEQLLRDALAAARAASDAKTDFLSRMSHDIRTPMNAIIGMTTIGQLKYDDAVRVKDCFHKIDASSKFLLSLINDILDMSKIESGKMELSREPFEFSAFFEEIVSIIYPQALNKNISFEVHHKEPLEKFYIGDELRIKQIVMNLLSNALKFTPEGGIIVLELEEKKRTNGFAYLDFTVSDNGIGMAEEFMDKIFQPFEQEEQGGARNKAGSGLGLSIVYNLVHMMGGFLNVKSQKGRGTSFQVTLPLGVTDDDLEAERERKNRELLKGTRVLVADDDVYVGEEATAILTDIGARCVYVDSGEKAVREVQEAVDEGWYFDIAMIDWRMPGMNGIETTRRIRTITGPDTTIIIISAYDWSSIEKEAREAGADYFIAKPLFKSRIYHVFSHLENGEYGREMEQQPEDWFDGKRVLLVEDNELNMEIAKSLLETYNIVVDTAENGRIAVERFENSPAGTYFAVLMDVRMPVMDGLQATRTIRAWKGKTPPLCRFWQ